jgi:predicted transcriptional regulator of viral defense system
MHDVSHPKPDHDRLFEIAASQGGYFTSAQARECGFSHALLSHHASGGRFVRARRGLYRLRHFPRSPRDHVFEAWLGIGRGVAVLSHESALELYGLSDVVPEEVDLTVPRSYRGRRRLPGVRIHTTAHPPGENEVMIREGIRVTAPARSIVDAASVGMAPEQVVTAARQALARGLATRCQLLEAARKKGRRISRLVSAALELEAGL